ncbi:MAG TPA: alpha/beta hydrolase [Longimicrobiales bacterium]|nr:alpha/beta hydrolase [Longimicrobiales bacterium]
MMLRSVALAFLMLPVCVTTSVAQAVQYADVNGVTLAYRSIGQGDPLVLLHGFTQTGATWEPLLADLSSRYRVIVPDLRGHGQSTNPSGAFSHRESAEDIFGLLDELGVGRFRAIGISSGGMTLLHMATADPPRVEAMVLIGATSYFPEEARAIQRQSHPDSVPQAQLDQLGASHSRGVVQARALLEQFHGMAWSYEDMDFTPPLLSTISAETLIVHGDRDRFFPVAIPVEQYGAIPDSYLWIVPNGPHVPLMQSPEDRTYFARRVLSFFAGEWR